MDRHSSRAGTLQIDLSIGGSLLKIAPKLRHLGQEIYAAEAPL